MSAPADWERLYREARKASFSRSASNPLSNPLFKTLISGALKGLKVVAVVTFAYEIAIVVQMLERYVEDRERDLETEAADAASLQSDLSPRY